MEKNVNPRGRLGEKYIWEKYCNYGRKREKCAAYKESGCLSDWTFHDLYRSGGGAEDGLESRCVEWRVCGTGAVNGMVNRSLVRYHSGLFLVYCRVSQQKSRFILRYTHRPQGNTVRCGQGRRFFIPYSGNSTEKWDVRKSRFLIEISGFTALQLVRGPLGIGTVIITLTIGHVVSLSRKWMQTVIFREDSNIVLENKKNILENKKNIKQKK